MPRRPLHAAVLFSVLIGLVAGAWADDKLASAYNKILEGDYDAGRVALAQIGPAGAAPEQVSRLENWLKSYHEMAAGRGDLRARTYAWHVSHSQQAIADAEQFSDGAFQPEVTGDARDMARARKVYLALSFAGQASLYTDNESAFAQEPWVKQLYRRGLDAAQSFTDKQKWTKAHSFYVLMERLSPKNEELKTLRDRAARHARLELLYGDGKEIERRIEGVEYEMLAQSVQVIDEFYYEKPNFRDMAEGAIDNLVALCQTTKLYDAHKFFNAIAIPENRTFFLRKLEARRRDVLSKGEFGYRDLLQLYKWIRSDSDSSVELPPQLLIVEFTEGALGKLDQFTSMIWPADSVDFDKQMMGNFFGVGIQLGTDEVTGRLKAVTALDNSPALDAGIQPDDLIIAVNGETTKNWTTDKAVRNITGEKGTNVTLTIFRASTGQTIDYKLPRSEIKLRTVRGVHRLEGEQAQKWNYMLDPIAGIGYIRLTGFNQESHQELHNALTDAKNQGMKGLILDLRYNPGGLLDVAVATVSEFIGRGADVVSTAGRKREEKQQLRTNGSTTYGDLPLVVLVNEASASASEILAGALQDHGRAAVLGERTFGKGSVQKVMGVNRTFLRGNKPDARLKLTTALYYLPNGRSPHKQPNADVWGVDPNWEIALTPKEIGKVLERERKAYIIHNEKKAEQVVDEESKKREMAALKDDTAIDEDREDDDLLTKEDIELLRSDPNQAPETDPQLETALLQLRVKLAGDLPWPKALAKSSAKDDKP